MCMYTQVYTFNIYNKYSEIKSFVTSLQKTMTESFLSYNKVMFYNIHCLFPLPTNR